jgi:hypothetical protein
MVKHIKKKLISTVNCQDGVIYLREVFVREQRFRTGTDMEYVYQTAQGKLF